MTPSFPCQTLIFASRILAVAMSLLGLMPTSRAAEVEVLNQATATYVDSTSGLAVTARSGTVRAVVSVAQIFSVNKSANSAAATAGGEVVFTLKAERLSAGATPLQVTVDGQPQALFLLRDTIPARSTFVRVARASGGTALYHRTGDSTLSYTSAAPADPALVDAVALGVANLSTGANAVLEFAVHVAAEATGKIENIADFAYLDGAATTPITALSNRVVVAIGATPSTLGFFTEAYDQPLTIGHSGRPLFLEARAPGLALDPAVVDRIRITVTSAKTGDRETFTAVETAPDSGIFRVEGGVPTRSSASATRDDGTLDTMGNDTITATLTDASGTTVVARLLIDPAGIVFDSKTNEPIAGAKVTLIDASTGRPASVFADPEGTEVAPSTVTTADDGRFQFPAVHPGVYRLLVAPPAGYAGPSKVRADQLPRGRTIDRLGSYGENFRVDETTGAVMLDYPLDFAADDAAGLFIRKSSARETAEIGDFVDYVVDVKNVTSITLPDVVVDDVLPFGFAYEKGTVRSGGKRLADPEGRGGPRLRFRLGALAADATQSITYRVRIGPAAGKGDATNRARACDLVRTGVHSNLSRYKIELREGVFTTRGVIIGKVFVDVNGNRVQDAPPAGAGRGWVTGEPGIPGVRIFLEDGTFAITDGDGKFSFYGLAPRLHVLKVDPITLPPGTRLEALSTRDAGAPGTQFVDLKNGQMTKANFATRASAELLEAVAVRRVKAAGKESDLFSNLDTALPREGDAPIVTDPLSQPASGIKGPGAAGFENTGAAPREETLSSRVLGPSGQMFGTNGFSAPSTGSAVAKSRFDGLFPEQKKMTAAPTLDSTNSNLPAAPVATVPVANLEQALGAESSPALGFLDLKDGDTLPIPQTTVRVKGTAGATFGLWVNGREIPATRIGKRVTAADKGIAAWEFIGVDLRPGANRVEAVQRDPFGNERGRVGITLIAPDKLGQIALKPSALESPADGRTPVKIAVQLLDDKGVPVSARTALILEASAGKWEVADLDRTQPGTQVFIEGGRAEFALLPPLEPGDVEIRVSSGTLRQRVVVTFLPELRPLLAVGLLEGRIHFNRADASSIVPTRSADGFEDELRSLAVGREGSTSAAGRAAFFLKGKIKGNYLLTAAYDSEKDTRERLFRDIQPDEFYPVYGDASVKGFDAQSSGRLYVRIDNRKSYLLYGDFSTQTTTEARQLSNYSRSLNGVREHFENKHVSANAWASYDSTKQVIEELPANGTSGPYQFRVANGRVNSEKVEILVRDRNQPSLVLTSTGVTRFNDYEFEPFTGRILFKSPVPSLDENLNPVSIRVTYESDQGGPKFWTYGGDAQVKLGQRVEIGGAIVREENPLNRFQMTGANLAVDLGMRTFLFGEIAQTDDELLGGGNAARLELRHQSEDLSARLYWTRADKKFLNPGASLTPGRMESGAQLAWKLDRDLRVLVQAIDTQAVDGGARRGVEAGLEYSFTKNIRLEIGGRYSVESTQPASASTAATPGATPNEVRSARIKLTLPLPWLPNGHIFGEWENDLVRPEARTIAIGGDYQLDEKTRLYARHELISSLGGAFELNDLQQRNTTVVGVESAYMKDGQLFNEVRSRSELDGPQTEAALGLRNQWKLADGLRANASFERTSPVKGATASTGPARNESTALTGGLEYVSDADWKASARLELRRSESEDSLLNTLGFATRLTDEWTFLGKSILYLTKGRGQTDANGISTGGGAGDKTQARIQAGFAYRPLTSDRWNALGKYEYKTEDDQTQVDVDLQRQVHILSLDVNYQPSADWQFAAHYAGKLALENSAGLNSTYDAHFLTTRATYDLTGSWDAALNVSAMFSSRDGSVHYGLSPEIGYTVRENLRVGVGYTFFGFSDPDLTSEEYTQSGVYLAVRFKFDESLFERRKRKSE